MQKSSTPNSERCSTTACFHETVIFHTTARNVGLFTSLSLVALGAARAMMSSNRHGMAVASIACSALFLLISIDMNHSLLAAASNKRDETRVSTVLPYAVGIAHVLMFLILALVIWQGVGKWRLGK